jgi:hypothetical protein
LSSLTTTKVRNRGFPLRVHTARAKKKRADERTRTADLISLRVRFVTLYLSRKVAYLQAKVSVAYRRVTLDYAQVSVPVSVRVVTDWDLTRDL